MLPTIVADSIDDCSPKNIAAKDDPALAIRLPSDLLAALTAAAARAGRSRNSEIIMRLRQSLELG
jgi:predicted HicB family RNase H-like nuclease